MTTQSLMDYLLPSSHEVPQVEIVPQCTPSPHTVFGQKGAGESGYMGAPAAMSGAINDAVSALGISFVKLPSAFQPSAMPSRGAINQGIRVTLMIIDCHAHLVPPSCLMRCVRRRRSFLGPPIEDGGSLAFSFCRWQADAASLQRVERHSSTAALDG